MVDSKLLDAQCEIVLLKEKLDWALCATQGTLNGIRGKTVRQVEQELTHIVDLLKY